MGVHPADSEIAPPVFLRLAGHPLRWRLLGELARSDLQVRELTTLVGQPQNLVSYHLGQLRRKDLVTARRSNADGRDMYYSLDIARCGQLLAAAGGALHPALRVDLASPPVPAHCGRAGRQSRVAAAPPHANIKDGEGMSIVSDSIVNVRYMVDDVAAAVDFYTTNLGFTLNTAAMPAFADITRGNLRLLLAGPQSSAGRPMPDGRRPEPGGWNRIHFIVDDITAEVARLRAAGVRFRNDVVTGPGGRQILLDDPSGNPIELFQPAGA